jgi:starvation-inducible DNA-binding protein
MEINIGLTSQERQAVVRLLNILLSDEYLLYTKTLNYHWNIYGPDFKALHVFLQEQYEEMLEIVDEIAERVRSLGHVSFGTMTEFLKNTRVKEYAGDAPESAQMIKRLLDDHESIIRSLRNDLEETARLHDMGTNNFLTEIMERHEKMAWMLRATLQK